MRGVSTLLAVLGSLAVAVAAVASASAPASARSSFVIDGRAIAARFPRGRSIVFRYPANWYVTTKRLDDVLDPHTLFAVSSYRLRMRPLDDCDGTHARGRPSDGVFLLVKEVLDGASLRRSLPRLAVKPRHLQLPTAATTGQAGCLAPPSVAYQFRVAKRAFYVWLSIGPRASAKTRSALSALIDGMWIAQHATP